MVLLVDPASNGIYGHAAVIPVMGCNVKLCELMLIV